MTNRKSYDVAVLTVIPAELHALQRALNIDSKQRERDRDSGLIFYPTVVHSKLLEEDIRIIVGCMGEPANAQSATITTLMLGLYEVPLIILMGIAAGMEGKLRIGDVIVPRDIVDVMVKELVAGVERFRPHIKNPPQVSMQMYAGFRIDEAEFHSRFRSISGSIAIPDDQRKFFEDHVNFSPKVHDSPLASSDTLLRDPSFFTRVHVVSPNVRAAEMEAAGFVIACNGRGSPQPWLVVRGISDFGNSIKNDDFHRLAASAAAAWVALFLEHGFDRGHIPLSTPETTSASIATKRDLVASKSERKTELGAVAMGALNAELEKLGAALSEARLQEFENLRAEWRGKLSETTLDRIHEFKTRADWAAINAEVKGKFLRFEASLMLSIVKDVPKAKELARQAKALDPKANYETLDTLLIFHEFDAATAIKNIPAPATLEGWNLKLGLLGEQGLWDDLLKDSAIAPSGVSPNPETHRLRALALLSKNRLSDARAEIERPAAAAEHWFMVRYIGAVIEYFESVSPALLPRLPKDWPMPVDSAFVRQDKAAVSAVRKAEAIFAEMIALEKTHLQTLETTEGWRLACLSNDKERRGDAEKYCAALLKKSPAHRHALAWATARGYSIESSGIEAIIREARGRSI